MSVLDHVKKLIAEVADGHRHAVEHVAAEVDSLKQTGLPAADLQKLTDAFETRAKSFFDSVDKEVRGRLATLEESVHALQAQLTPQPRVEQPEPEAQANGASNSSAGEDPKAAPADLTDGAPKAQ